MNMIRESISNRGSLTDNAVTLAELWKVAGYRTGMVGKWHFSETEALGEKDQLRWLSHQEDFGDFSATPTYPTARGFDKYYGNIWGVVDYFDPFSLVAGTNPVAQVPEGFYYTAALGDSAVAYTFQTFLFNFNRHDEHILYENGEI